MAMYRLPLLICLTAALLAGCSQRVVVPSSGVAAMQPAADVNDPFSYDAGTLRVRNRILTSGETRDYRIRRLQTPSSGENGQDDNIVSVDYHQSKKDGAKGLVIVLPIWGAYTYPPRKIVKRVRRDSDGGMNVMQLLGDNYLLDWDAMGRVRDEQEFEQVAAQMAERIRTTAIDLRRLVDWAQTQPDIDPDRIGLVGFSLGAVIAALVVSNEPRITAGALVMGGAHPADIFAACDGKVGELRETIKARFGWSTARYRQVFERVFAAGDPASYGGRVDPARVLMMDALHDQCMPKTARDALWMAMGRPERISFRYGHKTSFLAMTPLGFNYMDRRIFRFFDATLR